jgi:hypothetical protein
VWNIKNEVKKERKDKCLLSVDEEYIKSLKKRVRKIIMDSG